jgi:Homeodomain-like domain
MTLQARDKLMSLTDVSEMLGIPVHTLYRWRYRATGQPAIGLGVMSGIAERP